MIELQGCEFHIVNPVFEPLQYHLGVSAIIDRYIPGRIWVDDAENPETALIWDTRYSYYLSGYEDSTTFNMNLDTLITKTIAPEALKRNIRLYFVISPPHWEKKILNNEVLVDRYPKRMSRCYYTFKKKMVTTGKDKIPPGVTLNRVDENVLKSTLVNIDTLTDEVIDIIASVDEFIQRKFVGYCLVHKNEVVSWCLSFMYKSSCEFTVQTVEEYQKRGFGTITTAALIDSCLSHGFTSLGWHCGEENVASIKLAEKVGFERTTHKYSWIYGNL